ncbi:hypothetical protein [Endozoicomonas arenosclerae]|uniref:hypothetical protein n=1 Tax=Endozoicomonas arenosclerae TaxID=1633495 RepID=UPI000785F39C|nr:hypothetical protein [Endozoicomonas arenosclerae]
MSFRQLVSAVCFSLVFSFHAIAQAQPNFLVRLKTPSTPGLPPAIHLYTVNGELLQWELQLQWQKSSNAIQGNNSPDISLKHEESNMLHHDSDATALDDQQFQALMNFLESGFETRQNYQQKTTQSFMAEQLDGKLVDLDQLQNFYSLTLTDVAPVKQGWNEVTVTDNHGNPSSYQIKNTASTLSSRDKRNAKIAQVRHYLSLLENECSDLAGTDCLYEWVDDEPPVYNVPQQRLIRSINHVTDEYGNITNATIAPDTHQGPYISNLAATLIIAGIALVYIVFDIVLVVALICVCRGISKSAPNPKNAVQQSIPLQEL